MVDFTMKTPNATLVAALLAFFAQCGSQEMRCSLGIGASDALAGAPTSAAPAGLLSALQVEQPIRKLAAVYEAGPTLHISFQLSKPAHVTVEVARHLARGWKFDQWQDAYLAEPYLVRTLKLGRLEAGLHRTDWDGLNEQGKPVTETRITYPLEAAYRPKPDAPFDPQKLTEEEPVGLFRVTVRADGETAAANFRLLRGPVLASRDIPTWLAAGMPLPGGGFLASDWPNWRGRRYSAVWALEETLPHDAPGPGAAPTEAYDVAVDSRGNAYFLNAVGVYRYDRNGLAVPFAETDEVLRALAPVGLRHELGARIEAAGKDPVELQTPGGTKAFRRAELLERPGIGLRFGGIAIDGQDNLYLSRTQPDARIYVFNAQGKHLRTLKLPNPLQPDAIAVGRAGTLWIVGDDAPLARLNAQSGAVEKTVLIGEHKYARPRLLRAAPDGTLWTWHGTQIWRFSPEGELLPFTAKGPQVQAGGRVLNLSRKEAKAPAGAAGFCDAFRTLIPGPKGDVYVMSYRPHPEHGAPMPPYVLLHYAADGSFLPDGAQVSLAPYVPGNVFVDDAPAVLQLYVRNLAQRDEACQLDWTLTDFDGQQTRGTHAFVARAAAQQSLPLVLPASEIGHYALRAKVRLGDRTIAELDSQLARIRGRNFDPNPDSPFSIGWGNNMYLMGLVGSKFDRVALGGWDEPRQGVADPFPDLPEAVQVDQSRHTGYYQYARRWGVALRGVLGNSEPYLDNAGGPIGRIYCFDKFYQHVLHLVDRFRAKGYIVPEWHFWNEPNCFWFAPGPFGREFYGLVSKHLWCIIKARDKEAMYAADGDAGTTQMMEEFEKWGANRFTDAITIHYPGNTTLRWDQIVAPESPEGKVATVRRLIDLRDRSFPGRRVWNTEEGWWGAALKTPETGARAVPRTYLSQLAVGMDQVAWFAQSVGEDPTMLLRESDMTPWPAYCAFAAMTWLLEGAEYVGSFDLGPAAFATLFARGDRMVLAAWTVAGEKAVTLDAGEAQALVTDLVGRERVAKAISGKLAVRLSERVQYIALPRNDWTLGIAKAELRRRLEALKVGQPADLPAEIAAAATKAPTDVASMNWLYQLIQAAKLASLCGEMPAERPLATAAQARQAVVDKEGPDGYLRETRTALNWTERLALAAKGQGGHLDAAVSQAAGATIALVKTETPLFPGVAINAYVGEPGEIGKVRSIVPKPKDPNSTVDEKFRLEIPRKPGESFELELTIWNYYRHPIRGTIAPRLPEGWRADLRPSEKITFTILSFRFDRVVPIAVEFFGSKA
jgi:hypothetical protein